MLRLFRRLFGVPVPRSVSQRNNRLLCEQLEDRHLLSVASAEQLFVYMLNRARHNPQAYQQEANLSVSLANVAPRQPLAVNNKLFNSSEFKTEEMANYNYFAHQSPVTGDWPNKLARDQGYQLPSWFPNDTNNIESLAYGWATPGSSPVATAAQALKLLIEDVGLNPPGHRIHLLGMDSFNAQFKEVGVGHSYRGGDRNTDYWAIHTGWVNSADVFLTGVVFNDANGNGRYDLNEGQGNVHIQAGSFATTTNPAGGWSIKVNPNTAYDVTASGGSLIGVTTTHVSVNSLNVEVDFLSSGGGAQVNFVKAATAPTHAVPVADNAAATLTDDGLASVALTGSDAETAPQDLTFTIHSLPSHGQLFRPDGTLLAVGDKFIGSGASLNYKLRFAFGDSTDSFTFTVTDTGDPSGIPFSKLTSVPATVTLQTPANSAGIARIGGTGGADTIAVTQSSDGQSLQVNLDGKGIGYKVPLTSLNEVRVFGRGGNDSLQLLGLAKTAYFDGGDGSDTARIDGSAAAGTFAAGNSSIVYNGTTVQTAGIEKYSLNGIGGRDELIATDDANTWHITDLNAGLLNHAIRFSGIEDLTGGTGADRFVFDDGKGISGRIAAGGGLNSLDYTQYHSAVSVSLQTSAATGTGGISGINALAGGLAADTLSGAKVASTWTVTGVGTGNVNGFAFTGIEQLAGGSAEDTLVAGNGSNTWNITGANAGMLAGIVGFTGMEDLTGGAGSDTFNFADGRQFTGRIDGGDGDDKLNYSAWTTAVAVNLAAGNFANIEALVGGTSAADTLFGPTGDNAWNITSLNAGDVNGFRFSKIERLIGGTAGDTFTVADGARVRGVIGGGSGSDTLNLAAFATTLAVNLQTHLVTTTAGTIFFGNIEALAGGSSSDTLTGADSASIWTLAGNDAGDVNGFHFSAIENLAGGSQADVFAFQDGAALSGKLSGGGGIDTLDHSQNTTGVSVNLSTGAATGVLGGAAGGLSGIENVLGGAGSDNLTGKGGNNVLVGNAGNDILNGGAGRDVLIGGAGGDTISGGGSQDILVAGTTDYDQNLAALNLILAAWGQTTATGSDYSARAAAIAGSDFSAPLTSATVHDDAAADLLTGGSPDGDWFFAAAADGTDRNALTELLTAIS